MPTSALESKTPSDPCVIRHFFFKINKVWYWSKIQICDHNDVGLIHGRLIKLTMAIDMKFSRTLASKVKHT